MSKKENGWVKIDKGFSQHLPRDREYSPAEAILSYTIDMNSGNIVSPRQYAALWQWSRNRVIKFIEDIHSEKGYNPRNIKDLPVFYMYDPPRASSGPVQGQFRASSGPGETSKNNDLQEQKGQHGASSGPVQGQHGATSNKTKTKTKDKIEKHSASPDGETPHSLEKPIEEATTPPGDLRRDENPNGRVLRNVPLKKGMLYSKPFLDWWEAYCKLNNRDKMPAARVWNKHVTTWNDAELVIVATKNYANDLAGESWKAAKMGKTFLAIWREWIETPEAVKPDRIYKPGNGMLPEVGMLFKSFDGEMQKIIEVYSSGGFKLENGMRLS